MASPLLPSPQLGSELSPMEMLTRFAAAGAGVVTLRRGPLGALVHRRRALLPLLSCPCKGDPESGKNR